MWYLLAFLLGCLLTAVLIYGHADRDTNDVPLWAQNHLRAVYSEIARVRYRLDLLSPPPNKESIMSMVKHGNTIFPNTRVVRTGQKLAGSATAGTATGETGTDEQGELRVRVRWDDGAVTFEDPAALENA